MPSSLSIVKYYLTDTKMADTCAMNNETMLFIIKCLESLFISYIIYNNVLLYIILLFIDIYMYHIII